MGTAWAVSRLPFTVVVLALTAACGQQPGQGTFPSFVRQPEDRPVIGSGVAGLPTIVADPNVFADEEGYHLFYSAYFCHTPEGTASFSFDPERPEACSFRDAFGATAYAFSADRGLTWQMRVTPVVTRGAQEWNGHDLETPWVLRSDDRVYLFYSALSAHDFRYRLGVASLELGARSLRRALLEDGAVFESRDTPLVTADFQTSLGINSAQEPSAVLRNGIIDLFFVSLGLSRPSERFDAPDQELSIALRVASFDRELTPLEPPSGPLATGATANIPEVRLFDGRYRLFGTTTELDDHENDTLNYAVSEDGRQFTAPSTILRRSHGDAFDNWGLMAPTIVVEDDEVVLFYTAWEQRNQRCSLTGAGGRVGMPVESRPQEARCLYATLGRAVSPR